MRPKIYIPKFAKYVVMLRSFALQMIFASILKIDFLFFQETCEFSVLPMEIGDLKASSTQIFSVLARYLSSSKFSIEWFYSVDPFVVACRPASTHHFHTMFTTMKDIF